ncbi:hypothetical protein O181_004358 [Austropuccinia psidii MF-1]|uniref:Uncharacterized protein n=1 Tax=Austropuccinia psidii MF-1 TaxID=1389203 RepID=A0A9Q3BG69_9BASI|nr:hypothetical protein [Austropuccinia psidii MF-1]
MSTLYPRGLLHLLDEGAKSREVDLSDHFLKIYATIQENDCAKVSSTETPPDHDQLTTGSMVYSNVFKEPLLTLHAPYLHLVNPFSQLKGQFVGPYHLGPFINCPVPMSLGEGQPMLKVLWL